MNDDHDPEDAPVHELIMPFVVVQSAGGPYEDISFVAGYQCGQLDKQMESGENPIMVTRYNNLITQFDLIAMRHGYRISVNEEETNELWAHIGFEKG